MWQRLGKSEESIVMLKFGAQVTWKMSSPYTSVLAAQTQPALVGTTLGRLIPPMPGIICSGLPF